MEVQIHKITITLPSLYKFEVCLSSIADFISQSMTKSKGANCADFCLGGLTLQIATGRRKQLRVGQANLTLNFVTALIMVCIFVIDTALQHVCPASTDDETLHALCVVDDDNQLYLLYHHVLKCIIAILQLLQITYIVTQLRTQLHIIILATYCNDNQDEWQ